MQDHINKRNLTSLTIMLTSTQNGSERVSQAKGKTTTTTNSRKMGKKSEKIENLSV